ncbi:MAG TPA: L-threonylcarbamoyladenylate synthase [Candidatus Acidoferrum sp.]|nr:L-threonylcarbamoyladenylate synthase [Candidatus Acidoferrum sp.]
METEVLAIDALKPEMNRVSRAAGFIKEEKIVVFPTETVYGIGASAYSEAACRRIFEIKGRPADNPLIAHVSSLEMAQEIAEIPEGYLPSIKRIWPSPITFIARSRGKLPRAVTAGLDTISIRMPAHPVALALIKEAGMPIAAPSANPSGKPTATNAGQAVRYFKGKVDCIIDSGRSFFGVESTIIDLRSFTILRPGPFTIEEIERAFGKRPKVDNVARGMASADKPVSPGTKYTHYTPDTPVMLFNGKITELVEILDDAPNAPSFAFIGSGESCSAMSDSFGCSTIELGKRENPYEIAKNLYDGLIALDSLKVKFGIIEAFDEKGIGLAIMNRIRKATGNRSINRADDLPANPAK